MLLKIYNNALKLVLFWQYNAPAHTGKKVVKLFKDNNTNLIKHPTMSTDKNPIGSIYYKSQNFCYKKAFKKQNGTF